MASRCVHKIPADVRLNNVQLVQRCTAPSIAFLNWLETLRASQSATLNI